MLFYLTLKDIQYKRCGHYITLIIAYSHLQVLYFHFIPFFKVYEREQQDLPYVPQSNHLQPSLPYQLPWSSKKKIYQKKLQKNFYFAKITKFLSSAEIGSEERTLSGIGISCNKH